MNQENEIATFPNWRISILYVPANTLDVDISKQIMSISSVLLFYLSKRGFENKNDVSQPKSAKLNLKNSEKNFIVEIKPSSSVNQIILDIDVYYENDYIYTLTNKPPIIVLIEDYFKWSMYRGFYINTIWYLIETLEQSQIHLISTLKRNISPLMIRERVYSFPNDFDFYKNKLPIIIKIDYPRGDIYMGNINDFEDIIDYWLCCYSWIDHGRLDFRGLETHYFNFQYYYASFDLGNCIPVHLVFNDDVQYYREKEIIQYIRNSDERFSNIQFSEGYFMHTEWDNVMYLFKSDDFYFLYNWWTGE